MNVGKILLLSSVILGIVFIILLLTVFSSNAYAEKSDAELIQEIWDYCNYDGSSGQFSYGLEFRNETHFLDNSNCKWVIEIDPYEFDESLKIASEKVMVVEESMGFGSGTAIFDESGFSFTVIILGIIIGLMAFLLLMWKLK